MASAPEPAVNYIRPGFHTVTPYLILSGAAHWIEFVKKAFDAEEKFRAQRPGTETILHAEVRIADSMVEVGEATGQFAPMPGAIWLRVPDVDVSYRRALQAGAVSIEAPSDQEYGSRDGSVKDPCGNDWYLFTPKPDNRIFAGLRSVTPYLHPAHGAQFIDFLRAAFGGEEIFRAESPDGAVQHAQVRIGDSVIGLGEARGPYQPLPCSLHLYVRDAGAVYEQALRAGAATIQAPADQPYGDRSAGVRDPFGNRWFIATHLRDAAG